MTEKGLRALIERALREHNDDLDFVRSTVEQLDGERLSVTDGENREFNITIEEVTGVWR